MSNQDNHYNDSQGIKDYIKKAIAIKYFYIVSLIICLIAAYAVNKFSPLIFEVNSIIGPVEDERSALLASNELFSGLAAYNQSRNLQDDLISVRSFKIATSTINKLKLEVSYFVKKNNLLLSPELQYNSNPYLISIDKSHIQPIETEFHIKVIDNETFRLSADAESVALYNYIDDVIVGYIRSFKIDTICHFNQIITSSNFEFAVSINQMSFSNYNEYDDSYFMFHELGRLTQRYLNNTLVNPVNIRSSFINVSFRGKNLDLAIDYLNTYTQDFLDNNLSKKNQIAINTIKFIDSQISDISDSLYVSESQIRDYRSSNQVTDLSYQGQQALIAMTQVETELANLQIQERYYDYILEYFNKNIDVAGLAPPSAVNVVDPFLNTLIIDLMQLSSQRSTILSNNADKNLYLGQIENQIRVQKQTIIENVRNSLNTLSITRNGINSRSEKISQEISRLPRTELNMVSMQRKFDLTDAMYTFLLQKRSEAAITMASNFPDYEIVSPARRINRSILYPRKRVNVILALFFAFLIPSAYLILKNFFNNRITTILEVEQISRRKILNSIYKNPSKNEIIVSNSPTSAIAESFRNLRSSLFMRFRNEPLKEIIITSCQPQDGKSFVSFNLATSIAMVGRKTLILDGDMRRPTLHDKFKTDNSSGLSTFLANETKKEDLIRETQVDNLFFISAGPSLPNTSELIQSGSMDELIDWLRTKFDNIIIDSTPAGLVADSIQMIRYASIVLLVVRNDHTRKDDLKDIMNLFEMNKVSNFEIVINDLNINESKYGRYKHYFAGEKKHKFFTRNRTK